MDAAQGKQRASRLNDTVVGRNIPVYTNECTDKVSIPSTLLKKKNRLFYQTKSMSHYMNEKKNTGTIFKSKGKLVKKRTRRKDPGKDRPEPVTRACDESRHAGSTMGSTCGSHNTKETSRMVTTERLLCARLFRAFLSTSGTSTLIGPDRCLESQGVSKGF